MAPMRRWRIAYVLVLQLLFLQMAQAQIDFAANETTGCTPFPVVFTMDLSSVNADTISTVEWVFGDDNSASPNDTSPIEHVYTTGGSFTVALLINGYRSEEKADYITSHRTVSADFSYEEYAENHNFRFIPSDRVTDEFATYFYNWRYTEINTNAQRTNDYVITFDNQDMAIDSVTLDTGVYQVTLWIDDTYGCFSRFSDTIAVYDEILLPNVFVAGRPDPYQFYTINPLNINIVLRFQIFNRYGLLVYEQEAPIIRWDGKTNSGKDITTGVYYYVLEVVEGENAERFNQNGFIHLYWAN